ncbi:MAG: hypothetical protein HOI23_08660 [Deltaproteobacteria bacterium]|nr:hypothetical protein [Deltaproteobacteria bacterium]MBT6434644.1 hypothetical protein [Deltaproteobacteria bacterium]
MNCPLFRNAVVLLCVLGTAGSWFGCAAETNSQDSGTENAQGSSSEESDASAIAVSSNLVVDDSHRMCAEAADCRAVYIDCTNCEGGCEGVNSQFETAYEEALNCDGFSGPQCDYDCHPSFGLTQILCEEGLCVVREL